LGGGKKMRLLGRKQKVLFLLFVILTATASLMAMAAENQAKVRVKVNRANIRSGPSVETETLATVSLGTVLEVQKKEGDWYKVSFSSPERGTISGYIRQDLVETLKEEEAAEVKKPKPVLQPKEKRPRREFQLFHRLPSIGLKVGFNSSRLYGANVAEFEEYLQYEMKARGGLNVGAFIVVPIGSYFALQSEFTYAQKGAKTEPEVEGVKVKVAMSIDYFEIPALFRFYIPSETNFRPSLYAGTYFAFKLSSKVKGEAEGVKIEGDIENVRGTDAGFVFGAGFDFNLTALGHSKIAFDIRYTLGVTSLSTEPNVETKNKVLSFSVGYIF
jgi:hypothetical protein